MRSSRSLTGQRKVRVRLYRDTAGETMSTGPGRGAGVALTAAAGYPAPSVVGLGAAILLTIGHLTGMLLLGLVLLIAFAVAVRNLYGMLAVLVTAGLVASGLPVRLARGPGGLRLHDDVVLAVRKRAPGRRAAPRSQARQELAHGRRPARAPHAHAGRRLGRDLRPVRARPPSASARAGWWASP